MAVVSHEIDGKIGGKMRTAYGSGNAGMGTTASRKCGAIFRAGIFFLISLGGQAPHVRPMAHTCGERNEIELTAAHRLFYRSYYSATATLRTRWGASASITRCGGVRAQ